MITPPESPVMAALATPMENVGVLRIPPPAPGDSVLGVRSFEEAMDVYEDEDFSADDARYLCECLDIDAPDAQRARLACCSSYNTNHTMQDGDCAGDLVIPELERVENSLYSADIDIKTGLDGYGASDRFDLIVLNPNGLDGMSVRERPAGVVHTED